MSPVVPVLLGVSLQALHIPQGLNQMTLAMALAKEGDGGPLWAGTRTSGCAHLF